MHILSINKFFWRKGGSEAVFFGEKELLEERGHTVIPFSMHDPRNAPTPYVKYFVEHVDYGRGGLVAKMSAALKIIYSVEARQKMIRLLDAERVDVAHFHIFQHQISPSVFGPLRRRKIPVILTLHDLKPMCPNYKMLTHDGICERCKGRKFFQCFLHRCSKGSALYSLVNSIEMYVHYALGYYQNVDRYIAVSRFYREKMIEFGFPADKVVHIPNFMINDDACPTGEDRGYGLFFGRLSPEKGLSTLLRALASTPDIAFRIVGDGPAEQELRLEAAKRGLRKVEFLGFKTGGELQKLVRECSFTVIPSEWYENCPMSVLESFAFAKPVIGARIGGIPELVEEDVDGLTFEPGDWESLGARLRVLWSDPEKRRVMGLAGRRKVEREHSVEQHYDRLMKVYGDVVSGARR